MDPFSQVRANTSTLQYKLLLAVEQSLVEAKMQLIPTAYFASMVMLLNDKIASVEELLESDADEINGILYLLSVVTSHVPNPVLQMKYSDVLSVYERVLSIFHSQENCNAIIRHCIECMTALLTVQPPTVWSSPDTVKIHQQMMLRLFDQSPKVRKVAQLCCLKLVRFRGQGILPLKAHPSRALLVKLLCKIVEDISANLSTDQSAALCHLLSFVQSLWKYLDVQLVMQLLCGKNNNSGSNSSGLNALSERLNNSTSFNHAQKAHLECMNSLISLITRDQEASAHSDEDDSGSVGIDVNSFTMTIFRKCFDPILALKVQKNVDCLPIWLTICAQCAVYYKLKFFLADVQDQLLISGAIAGIYSNVFGILFMNMGKEVRKMLMDATQQTLCSIIDTFQMDSQQSSDSVVKCLQLTQKGMNDASMLQYSVILKVVAHWVTIMDLSKSSCLQQLTPVIKQLQRDENALLDGKCRKQFEGVLCALIGSMTCAAFLKIFPIELTDKQPRVWLFPLLKSSVQKDCVGFYIDSFVPMARQIAQKGKQLEQNKQLPEAKTCQILWKQIWDILPSFCVSPQDLIQSFDDLCSIILPILQDVDFVSDDGRLQIVVESLRNIVKSVLTNGDKEQSQFLELHAENILGLLLSKYMEMSATKDSQLNSLNQLFQECIKLWSSVCQKDKLNSFIGNILKSYIQLTQTQQQQDKRHLLLDLVNIMFAGTIMPIEAVQLLLRLALLGFEDDDGKIQKKSYKLLTEMLSIGKRDSVVNGNDNSIEMQQLKEFLVSAPVLTQIKQKLIDTMLSVEASAKKDRLQAIEAYIDTIGEQNVELLSIVPEILSEIVMGTKESNDKARQVSYELIVKIGTKMQQVGGNKIELTSSADQDDDQELQEDSQFICSISEYLKMVMAGLAAQTPHMISATINALARLLYCFNDNFESEIIKTVLLYAFESRSREIIKSAVSFIKVVIVVNISDLQQEASGMIAEDAGDSILDLIINACLKWSSEHKSHFKVSCRYIIERLVRRIGLYAIRSHFPVEHEKLLTNIRKRMERAKKQSKQKKDGVDGNGDDAASNGEEGNDSDSVAEFGDDNNPEDEEELPDFMRDLMGGQQHAKSSIQQMMEQLQQGEDEPIDMLQSNVQMKLAADRGAAQRQNKRKRSNLLPVSNEGKLIVNAEQNHGKGRGQKNKRHGQDFGGVDEQDDFEPDSEDEMVGRTVPVKRSGKKQQRAGGSSNRGRNAKRSRMR
ncbi:hypothetical protein MIR68_006923 [Amoeboaphelidium protococcarum]|nr:hypothetical protein MIR68_006923 [Amoeboaphelidium protococcarum]